jgi:hypothetical protein
VPPVSANVDVTNVNCYGGSNGTIVVSNISGGIGSPYYVKLGAGGTYQLTTTSRTYSNLTQGNYDVYVTDSDGYVTTYNVTLTQPSEQSASIVVNTYATCNGTADGVITLSSLGGVFPKTYKLYADTTAPYVSCGSGDLIGTYTNITSGSPSVTVTGIDEYGYCVEVTDANGCVTYSGVVDTTSCTGTCYTITIPSSMLTYNGESLYVTYRKTDTTYVSEPYYSFPTDFSPINDYIIHICSTQYPSFKYGVNGSGFIDAGLDVVTNGKCDNSEWCGGADPYIAPTPTPVPPSGGYFCRDNVSSPCIEQVVPCSNFQIPCNEFDEQV